LNGFLKFAYEDFCTEDILLKKVGSSEKRFDEKFDS
jgi:hypothetical protein